MNLLLVQTSLCGWEGGGNEKEVHLFCCSAFLVYGTQLSSLDLEKEHFESFFYSLNGKQKALIFLKGRVFCGVIRTFDKGFSNSV